jgi:hypothetical protein
MISKQIEGGLDGFAVLAVPMLAYGFLLDRRITANISPLPAVVGALPGLLVGSGVGTFVGGQVGQFSSQPRSMEQWGVRVLGLSMLFACAWIHSRFFKEQIFADIAFTPLRASLTLGAIYGGSIAALGTSTLVSVLMRGQSPSHG